ncbi:MAG: ABC transporter ATP-binding protein [Bacteroidales bacterium]
MSIKISHLNKRYPNGYYALKDVNLEIPGGMFGLLGPNGAGKSTLMRILVSLLEPTSGKVNVYGYDLVKDRKKIRSLIGYLPQDFRFFAKYKTYEFLDYAARLSDMNNTKVRKAKVDEMLEKVGLYDVKDRYASKLSGGMKRRLGIAQALIHDPKLIIVDEPTTGLDPEERIRFRNILSEVTENDVTILLSTHIVGDISSSCNSMAFLNRGEIAYFGTPEDMLSKVKNKAWKISIEANRLSEVEKKYPIIATIPKGKKWEVFVVADQIEGFDYEPCQPNLEYAYVYFMENYIKE